MQTFSYTLSGHTNTMDGCERGFVAAYESDNPYVGALDMLASLHDGWVFYGTAVTIRGSFAEQRLVYEHHFDVRYLDRVDDGVTMMQTVSDSVYRIAVDGEDMYAVGHYGNWFATAERARGAIAGLKALGPEWGKGNYTVVERPAASLSADERRYALGCGLYVVL